MAKIPIGEGQPLIGTAKILIGMGQTLIGTAKIRIWMGQTLIGTAKILIGEGETLIGTAKFPKGKLLIGDVSSTAGGILTIHSCIRGYFADEVKPHVCEVFLNR